MASARGYTDGMYSVLAYADTTDSSGTNLVLALGGLFIIVATAALMLVLIFSARARRHPRAEIITAAAVFWALLTAGSLLFTVEQRVDWSKNYTLRLMTGYPQDTSDKPKLPWAVWAELGAGYGAMLVWSLCQKRAVPPKK